MKWGAVCRNYGLTPRMALLLLDIGEGRNPRTMRSISPRGIQLGLTALFKRGLIVDSRNAPALTTKGLIAYQEIQAPPEGDDPGAYIDDPSGGPVDHDEQP